MANPEHLKILKQGVEAWNSWREEHPEEKPDLTGADLKSQELVQVDFSTASKRTFCGFRGSSGVYGTE